jgi:hypothetical protein
MKWTEVISTVAASIIALSVLPVAGKFMMDLRERWRNWRQPSLWPTRSVGGSVGQPPRPISHWFCLHDHHKVAVNYEAASGYCSACGARYRIKFMTDG